MFLRYGESKPYKKHIITLDTCSPIDQMEVEQYKTEKEVFSMDKFN